MQRVVGVKFNSPSKIYSFDAGDRELALQDNVIVETEYGLSFGTVATAVKQIEEDNPELKPVLRKATAEDEKQYKILREKANKALAVAKEKVKKLGLEMKVVSSDYTFDGSKVVIDFSADNRVDFRELLKELASVLKVRIELHQVGQRDEVKIKGGIGPCGEICCCTRFLNDFEHVTVKMAKNQGLSLSPTKISGLCGRLMCCLAYENSMYEEILKRMPKVNSEVSCPAGAGVVVYNDILRERVSVKVKNGEDSFVVYDYDLGEIEVKPKASETEAGKPRQDRRPDKEKKPEAEKRPNADSTDASRPSRSANKRHRNRNQHRSEEK